MGFGASSKRGEKNKLYINNNSQLNKFKKKTREFINNKSRKKLEKNINILLD